MVKAFLARLDAKSRKSYCTTPGVGIGVGIGGSVGVSQLLKFYVTVFYVMGKALSGKLSCPCDRSCSVLTHHYGPCGVKAQSKSCS